MELSTIDRKGLIREAFKIEGITVGECRSIFLDWALNLPADQDNKDAINLLLTTYDGETDDHPMKAVLREGLAEEPQAKRRGGRKARLSSK